MNSKFKKLISVFISVIMIETSFPITSFASDADLTALKDEIARYESTMDGTVYENMQDAFEKYATAKEYAYAYEYGNKTDLNIAAAADSLSAAINNMTNNPWSSPKGNATPSFPDDSTDEASMKAYEGNVVNLLYSPKASEAAKSNKDNNTEGTNGSGKHVVEIKMYYPTTVMLYDGIDTPIMPVLATAQKQDTGKTRFVYSIYPSTSMSDKTASPNFALTDNWNGAGGEVNHNINWTWTALQTEESMGSGNYGRPGTTDLSSTDDSEISTATPRLELKNSGGFIGTGIGKVNYIASLSNSIKFIGNESIFGDNYYALTGIYWRRITGESISDYLTMEGNKSIFIVNYKPLLNKINSSVSLISSGPELYIKNKADASTLLGTVDTAAEYDPNVYFGSSVSESTIAVAVNNCVSELKDNLTAIEAVSVSTSSLNDYNKLAENIVMSKSVYDSNNSSGKYSSESFAAFKTAFEASRKEAAAVAENGFTTATTANALKTAYDNLNVVVKPEGASGDTSYSFDSETGVLTITGPGAMEDYESADASPFGNNNDITSVVIAEGVTNIGENAFNKCYNLKSITVPASLTYGENAFTDCNSLETVYIVNGEIKNASADNAPWSLRSVIRVYLGADESDLSVTGFESDVFKDCQKKTFYVYNSECSFVKDTNSFGNDPRFYCYVPSTAYYFADKSEGGWGCPYNSLGHSHSWVLSQVVEPTCTSSGYTVYKCKYESVCSETSVGDFVTPLGHDYVLNESVPASCTENGYDVYSCTRCDHTEKRNNGSYPLGHSYDGAVSALYNSVGDNVYNPSQTYKHQTMCSRCNTAYKEDYCSFEITGDTKTIGEDVYIKFSCSVCNGSYYLKSEKKDDECNVFFIDSNNKIIGGKAVVVKKGEKLGSDQIPELPENTAGHVYKWQLNNADFDTDEIPLYQVNEDLVFHIVEEIDSFTVNYRDDNNNIIYSENVLYGNKPQYVPSIPSEIENAMDDGHRIYKWENDINPADITITSATEFRYINVIVDHNFEETVDIVPTCTEYGYNSQICKDCGFTIAGIEIPKLEHTPGDTVTENEVAATCVKKGSYDEVVYCTVCGNELDRVSFETDLIEHTPEVVEAVEPTCTSEGLTEGSRCSVCGTDLVAQEAIPMLEHTWDDGVKSADGKQIIYTCSACGTTKAEDAPAEDPSKTDDSSKTDDKKSDNKQQQQGTTPSKVVNITPSDKEADAAPVNKSISKPKKIKTVSLSKKKQMRITFSAIPGTINYRVMYRKAGAKSWNYAWTGGKTEYYLKNLKKNGLYEFCFSAYKKNASGKWERGDYSKITRRYYFKHKIKKLKGSKGTITVKWKKKKGASNYQIQYSLKKNMSKAKTITVKNPKATSYKIKGLKKGKKYYVRIRANKKSNKNTYIGEYSKRKKVKA